MEISKQKCVVPCLPSPCVTRSYRQTPDGPLPPSPATMAHQHKVPRQTNKHLTEENLDLTTGASHTAF